MASIKFFAWIFVLVLVVHLSMLALSSLRVAGVNNLCYMAPLNPYSFFQPGASVARESGAEHANMYVHKQTVRACSLGGGGLG